MLNLSYDAVIIGAGAAGSMCAITAAKRGRKVMLIDHSKKFGEKIRISGGGKCNFTNAHCGPDNFISTNPRFCISALNQYTQKDFIDLIESQNIPYHEKKLGQLFCDRSAKDILALLKDLASKYKVHISLAENNIEVQKVESGFKIATADKKIMCQALVIASGGLSIPKIGATRFGYEIAQSFNHEIIKPRPGLVPLTFENDLLAHCKHLSGLSLCAEVTFEKTSFREGLLFTHRGLSGPVILQISSYWRDGESLIIDLLPKHNVKNFLKKKRNVQNPQNIQTILSDILPKRLVQQICVETNISGSLANISNIEIQKLSDRINHWQVGPTGTEGYRTAEVTVGGVNTRELTSKTMESNLQPGLYFVGEVVDVTGHLGGHNFQWAWSSGWVAGQNI
jgi:predicted Rossmann fold flavoprotein